jgi:hypothetical protein
MQPNQAKLALKILIPICFGLGLPCASAVDKDHYAYEPVLRIIEAVASEDRTIIADSIRYPLRRSHPVPDIK